MQHIHPIFHQLVQREERQQRWGFRSGVFWLTGLSGSGKSTIAQTVEHRLVEEGLWAKVLDGDNIRTGISNNLTFSVEDRRENIRRIAEVAKLFCGSNMIVLASFISPTREIRAMARDIIGPDDFHEVYINAPLEVCEDRDVKGLYKKARKGEIPNFTGIDSPYEAPQHPALEIRTDQQELVESVEQVLAFVRTKTKTKTKT